MPSAPPEVLVERPGFLLARRRNVMFSAWADRGTSELVDAMAEAGRDLGRKYERLSAVTILTSDAGLPTPEGRLALERLVAASAPRLSHVALLLGGAGFRLSSMRSYLTGLHVAQRRQYKTRTFMAAVPAAEWLVPGHVSQTGVQVSVADITGAIDMVMARLEG